MLSLIAVLLFAPSSGCASVWRALAWHAKTACRDRKQIVPRDLFSASRVTATKNGIFSHFWWGQSYHGKCGGGLSTQSLPCRAPLFTLKPKGKRKNITRLWNSLYLMFVPRLFFFCFLGGALANINFAFAPPFFPCWYVLSLLQQRTLSHRHSSA